MGKGGERSRYGWLRMSRPPSVPSLLVFPDKGGNIYSIYRRGCGFRDIQLGVRWVCFTGMVRFTLTLELHTCVHIAAREVRAPRPCR